MRALPDVWVHRRPEGNTFGSIDGELRAAADRSNGWLRVLLVLTRNEFRARYRAQALGILWSLLNPLVTMVILSAVFTRVFHVQIPNYPVFVLIGFVVWQWVSNGLGPATQTFVTHADIVKRTVFSRHVLPIASVLSYGINFVMESSLLILLAFVFPHAFRLSPALLLVPVIVALLAALLGGVALATSVLNVVYRDVAYLVTTGLTLLYWLTPIIYALDRLSPVYRRIMVLGNPLAAMLVALRGCLMEGVFPSPLVWAGMVVPTLLVVLIGWLVFRHYERMVVDYV
jgi:ABC-type polysaccharide/polyol phosphate export permease